MIASSDPDEENMNCCFRMASGRGAGAGIYRTEHQFWTLGSNRRTKEGLTGGAHRSVGLHVGLAGPHVSLSLSSLVESLLESSHAVYAVKFYDFL